MLRILSSSSEKMVLDNGTNPALFFGIVLCVVAVIAAYFAFPSFLSYPSDVSSALVALPFGFFVFGIISLLSASWTTVTVTRSHGHMVLFKKKLCRTEKTTYDITNIQRVELRMSHVLKKVNMAPSGAGALLSQPFLQPRKVTIAEDVVVLKNGKEIMIGRSEGVSESMGLGFSAAESSTLSRIATFMGVRFVRVGE
jgi:hypothetical protein